MEYELWSVEELIKKVSLLHKLIWGDGDFFQVASFIEGYVGGRGQPFFDEFTEFKKWLSEKYYKSMRISRSTPWYVCIWEASNADSAKSEFELLVEEFDNFKLYKSDKKP